MANFASSSDPRIASPYWLEDLLKELSSDDITADFEEWQKLLTLPTQGVAAQFTEAAGKSTEANILCQHEREKMNKKDLVDPDQQARADSPSKKETESSNTRERRERRKEICKKSRLTCKEREKKMECELNELIQQNKLLQDENMNLGMEKKSISKSLRLQDKDAKQFESDIGDHTSSLGLQQQLIDYFTKQLDVSIGSHSINHGLELKKLQNENMVLSQTNWDDWATEKVQLSQKKANLEHQKKLLQLQMDVLCEKVDAELDAARTN